MKVYSLHARKWAFTAYLLVIPTASLSGQAESSPCAETTAVRALIRAYVLSSPLFESKYIHPTETIQEFVRRESMFFLPGGQSIRCAQTLSARLLRIAIESYEPDAYERAMAAGPSEFAGDVARSVQRPALMFMEMALELHWLANVLPSLASGDATLYNTTGPHYRPLQKQGIVVFDVLIAQPDNRYLIGHLQSQMRQIETLAQSNVLAVVTMLR